MTHRKPNVKYTCRCKLKIVEANIDDRETKRGNRLLNSRTFTESRKQRNDELQLNKVRQFKISTKMTHKDICISLSTVC